MIIIFFAYVVLIVLAVLFMVMVVIPFIRLLRDKRMRHPRPPHFEEYERTDEVFTDPTTGLRQRVWFNAKTGERYYEPLNTTDEHRHRK